MKKRIIFIALSLLFLLPIVFSETASAAGVAISPPKFEFEADPGQVINAIVKITNHENSPLTFSVSAQDFVSSGESGQPTFINPEENTADISLANWIVINNNEPVTIKSEEKREVPFTINVPQNAEPGGHYGTIFFSPAAPINADGQVAVKQKIGSLILIRVSGKIVEKGELSVFGTYDKEIKSGDLLKKSSNFFYGKLPVNFVLRYENKGNIHLKPQGKIEIFDTFNKKLNSIGVLSIISSQGLELEKKIVDFLPVNDVQGNVLAKSFRKFDVAWQGYPYWYKEEDGTKVIKYKGYPIGWYTAKLTLNETGNSEVVKSISFVILPWKDIFGSLLILILAIFGFIKYRKWSIAKLEKKLRQKIKKENTIRP